jgi:uncharacterized membrane protein YraQ (UPF0718 family)
MFDHQRKRTVALVVFGLALLLAGLGTGFTWHAPALEFVIAWSLGVVGGAALVVANDKTALNQQKKLEWQAQDEKLMAAVTSDREKQLQAKISTLEAALKTALKKRDA